MCTCARAARSLSEIPPSGDRFRRIHLGFLHRGRKVGRVARAAADPEKEALPTFIMLTSLTPEGIRTIRENPRRIEEVNREIEQLGATVKAQ